MLISYKYLIITFIYISTFFCSESNNDSYAFEYFMMAEYELFQNNYKLAEKYYKKALLIAPNSSTILQSLAELKKYNGEYSQAITYLEKNFSLNPYNKDIGIQLFELYNAESNSKAKIFLDSLLFIHTDDLDIFYLSANFQFSNKEWKKLINTYKSIFVADNTINESLLKMFDIGEATDNLQLVKEMLMDLKLISTNKLILELLIKIAEKYENHFDAISLYYELIDLENNSDEILIKICYHLLRLEKFTEVIDILEPIYNSGNLSFNVLKLLLFSYSLMQNYYEEVKVCSTMIKMYPDISMGYEALSYAYLNIGNHYKSIEVLKKAIKKFPDDFVFPHLIANLFHNLGEYKKGKEYYHKVLDLNPDLISAKHSLALLYEDMDDTYHADSLFLEMINQNIINAGGRNDYAYILSERKQASVKDYNFALKLAEEAIQIDPNNAAFLDTIGWIYYKLGTYQKAKEYIEKSLSINDNNLVILEHLGDIFIKLNKFSQAKNIYEKILDIDSSNLKIKDKINQINE